MAQTLVSLLVHVIFSTKNREPFISAEIESELFAYWRHSQEPRISLAACWWDCRSHSLTNIAIQEHRTQRIAQGCKESKLLLAKNKRE